MMSGELAMDDDATATTTRKILPINIANVVGYFLNAVVVNYVNGSGKFPTNGDISAKYPTLLTPAGYAFAIWSVIFIAQLHWAIAQIAVPSYRQTELVVSGVKYYYLWVCFAQIVWTILFTLEQITLSLFAMISILIPLLCILYFQSKITSSSWDNDADDDDHDDGSSIASHDHRNEENNDSNNGSSKKKLLSFWLLKFPFEIQAGWIIAATIVNFNVVLVATHAPSIVQVVFAWISLAIVSLAAVVFLMKRKWVIPLVLTWASHAISVELRDPKEAITTSFSPNVISTLQTTSAWLAIVLLVATLVLFAQSKAIAMRRSSRPSPYDYERVHDEE